MQNRSMDVLKAERELYLKDNVGVLLCNRMHQLMRTTDSSMTAPDNDSKKSRVSMRERGEW